ncbi:MAG: flagellar protein FlaG [Gammaproteobacteria bacterium]|nr:flagellar protein FlaG [Gammaproteobacteria bacterium]MDH5801322.1 flagellar protein FlaG [Gammaproteobacteria bacterium]
MSSELKMNPAFGPVIGRDFHSAKTDGTHDLRLRVETTKARAASKADDKLSQELKDPKQSGQSEQTTQSISLKQALDVMNEFVLNSRADLNFSVDEDTGSTVVKVINRESKELIRQIPSEEVLSIVRRMAELEEHRGNLLNTEV